MRVECSVRPQGVLGFLKCGVLSQGVLRYPHISLKDILAVVWRTECRCQGEWQAATAGDE